MATTDTIVPIEKIPEQAVEKPATSQTSPSTDATSTNPPVQGVANTLPTAIETKNPIASAEKETTPIPSQTSGLPTWPALDADHLLTKFAAKLGGLLDESNHNEVYGLTLVTPPDFHTYLILQKFLRANANDLDKAATQLLGTLKWRRDFKPLETITVTHSQQRFGGLGYIVEIEGVPDTVRKQIVTFNLYGSVKDPKLTFEDIEGFMKWRVALMELGLKKLDLKNANEPIPDYGKGDDPYQAIQVHDYMQVSFIRQNPYTKAASKKTIETFRDFYPETLSRKFFVNVPIFMGWMFNAVSLVLSKETVKKFTVLSYGNTLNTILGNGVPEVYGGKGEPLEKVGTAPVLDA